MNELLDKELLQKLGDLVGEHRKEILNKWMESGEGIKQSIETALRISRTINYFVFIMLKDEKCVSAGDLKFVKLEGIKA